VAIRYQPDGVVLEICDDGHGLAGTAAGRGHGLVGMAERAVTLGGQLEAGPRSSGGFRVWSSLPAGRGV
jgi:glucose-6-phosphate-specific signal transduction histidine kinase